MGCHGYRLHLGKDIFLCGPDMAARSSRNYCTCFWKHKWSSQEEYSCSFLRTILLWEGESQTSMLLQCTEPHRATQSHLYKFNLLFSLICTECTEISQEAKFRIWCKINFCDFSQHITNITPKCIHLCTLPCAVQKATFLYATSETPVWKLGFIFMSFLRRKIELVEKVTRSYCISGIHSGRETVLT